MCGTTFIVSWLLHSAWCRSGNNTAISYSAILVILIIVFLASLYQKKKAFVAGVILALVPSLLIFGAYLGARCCSGRLSLTDNGIGQEFVPDHETRPNKIE